MPESPVTTGSNPAERQAGRKDPPARSLTVAIPAFNEERNIEGTVAVVAASAAKVPGLGVEILVVDDGSTDRTAEIVGNLSRRENGVRLIRNTTNIGLGASIRRAIELARGDKFLIVPGDNDIPADTLELLFRNAYAADVVMCYFHNTETRGRLRFLLSELFLLIYTTCFDLYAQYLNGPAVYPLGRLRGLDLHATKFSIVSEINVKLLREGVSFIEVASNRKHGPEGSTALRFLNLIETIQVFLQVLLDVYVRQRSRYAHRPVRLPYERSPSPAAQEVRRDHPGR